MEDQIIKKLKLEFESLRKEHEELKKEQEKLKIENEKLRLVCKKRGRCIFCGDAVDTLCENCNEFVCYGCDDCEEHDCFKLQCSECYSFSHESDVFICEICQKTFCEKCWEGSICQTCDTFMCSDCFTDKKKHLHK